jgi:hypothetical protein
MGTPPTGRARELLTDKALRILGQPWPTRIEELVTNYAAYREEENASLSTSAAFKQSLAVRKLLDQVTAVPASDRAHPFTATDGSGAVNRRALAAGKRAADDHWDTLVESARRYLELQPQREIEGKEKLTVATDTYGSPEKRLMYDCVALLAQAGQRIRYSRKGNVRALARTIIKIATGNNASLAGIALTGTLPYKQPVAPAD